MATVTGFTSARMLDIENNTIVDAEVVGGDLILTKQDTSTVNAGSVIGPTGAPGADGADGDDGAAGPAGPTALVGPPLAIATSTPALSASGAIVGLVRNNVPVVQDHTYGLKVDFETEFSSLTTTAEWHIWVRLNGANLEKIALLRPVQTGVMFLPVRGEIFWVAPTTQSTDDFDVYAQEIAEGATITPNGSSTSKRKFSIVDYGILS